MCHVVQKFFYQGWLSITLPYGDAHYQVPYPPILDVANLAEVLLQLISVYSSKQNQFHVREIMNYYLNPTQNESVYSVVRAAAHVKKLLLLEFCTHFHVNCCVWYAIACCILCFIRDHNAHIHTGLTDVHWWLFLHVIYEFKGVVVTARYLWFKNIISEDWSRW